MQRRRSAVGLAVFATTVLMLVSGCTQRILDFTVISSKNTSIRVKDEGKGARVTGEDKAGYFIFPLGNPQVKNAVDRAIEAAGPGYDALLDGVIYNHFNVFLFVGSFGFSVEGTPIKTSMLIAELKEQGIDPDAFFALHVVQMHSTRDASQ